MSQERAKDWLEQAQNDAEWAEHTLAGGYYAQACFIAQQFAEKALKALLYQRNASAIFTHSLSKMLKALALNGELQEAASILDLYYVGARYPDVLVEGTPSGTFTERQAVHAIALARRILAQVEAEVTP